VFAFLEHLFPLNEGARDGLIFLVDNFIIYIFNSLFFVLFRLLSALP